MAKLNCGCEGWDACTAAVASGFAEVKLQLAKRPASVAMEKLRLVRLTVENRVTGIDAWSPTTTALEPTIT